MDFSHDAPALPIRPGIAWLTNFGVLNLVLDFTPGPWQITGKRRALGRDRKR